MQKFKRFVRLHSIIYVHSLLHLVRAYPTSLCFFDKRYSS